MRHVVDEVTCSSYPLPGQMVDASRVTTGNVQPGAGRASLRHDRRDPVPARFGIDSRSLSDQGLFGIALVANDL